MCRKFEVLPVLSGVFKISRHFLTHSLRYLTPFFPWISSVSRSCGMHALVTTLVHSHSGFIELLSAANAYCGVIFAPLSQCWTTVGVPPWQMHTHQPNIWLDVESTSRPRGDKGIPFDYQGFDNPATLSLDSKGEPVRREISSTPLTFNISSVASSCPRWRCPVRTRGCWASRRCPVPNTIDGCLLRHHDNRFFE